MKRKITEEFLGELRKFVRLELSDRRYSHTIAVEDEAAVLSDLYCPERRNDLRAAALLHDITKEYNTEKQLKLCEKYDILVTDLMRRSPKCFHAKTARAVAEDKYGEYLDDDMLDAIEYHTTGKQDMTVFEKILYLADYTEPTRTFGDCIKVRKRFYDNIKDGSDLKRILDDTLLYSFDLTINDLIENREVIMNDTFEARNYLCLVLSNDQ